MKRHGLQRVATVLAAILAMATPPPPATAEPSIAPRAGWRVIETEHAFGDLAARLDAAIKEAGMLRVYAASASRAARGRGVEIPGNRVVGVYRNDYAVRMLEASVAAGMEAPIEFYVTEDADGGATLSYKTPSFVFAPYYDDGGDPLRALATELDAVFAAIAEAATAP